MFVFTHTLIVFFADINTKPILAALFVNINVFPVHPRIKQRDHLPLNILLLRRNPDITVYFVAHFVPPTLNLPDFEYT